MIHSDKQRLKTVTHFPPRAPSQALGLVSMAGSDQALAGPSSRLGQMVQLVVKALLARSPAYVWRVLRVAFSPSLILRKLALVSLLQLLAYAPQPS